MKNEPDNIGDKKEKNWIECHKSKLPKEFCFAVFQMHKQGIPPIDTGYKDYKHQEANPYCKFKQTKHP